MHIRVTFSMNLGVNKRGFFWGTNQDAPAPLYSGIIPGVLAALYYEPREMVKCLCPVVSHASPRSIFLCYYKVLIAKKEPVWGHGLRSVSRFHLHLSPHHCPHRFILTSGALALSCVTNPCVISTVPCLLPSLSPGYFSILPCPTGGVHLFGQDHLRKPLNPLL